MPLVLALALVTLLVGLGVYRAVSRARPQSCNRFANTALDYNSPPAVAAATPQEALSAFRASPDARSPVPLSPGPYYESPSGNAVQLVSADGRSTVNVSYGPGGWYVTGLQQCWSER